MPGGKKRKRSRERSRSRTRSPRRHNKENTAEKRKRSKSRSKSNDSVSKRLKRLEELILNRRHYSEYSHSRSRTPSYQGIRVQALSPSVGAQSRGLVTPNSHLRRTLSPITSGQSRSSVTHRDTSRSVSPEISGRFSPLSQLPERENEDSQNQDHEPNIQANKETDTLDDLDEEVLDMLGVDPNKEQSPTYDLHQDVALRLTHWLQNGIDKDKKDELLKKYGIPNNCNYLNAPTLNDEIKIILKSSISGANTLRKDSFQMQLQTQLGKGISAIGIATNIVLKEKDLTKILLPSLSDALKLLGDLQFLMSKSRRYVIEPYLGKNAKEVARQCQTDEFLFGKNFTEKWKTEKQLVNTTKELKANFQKDRTNLDNKKHFLEKPGSSRQFANTNRSYSNNEHRNLNRKAPPYPPREMRVAKGHYYPQKKPQRKY